jgi:hypothetical protein
VYVIMKKQKNNFRPRTGYLFLVSLMAFGLFAIIGTKAGNGESMKAGNVNASEHVRLEFASVNYGWDGMDVELSNTSLYGTERQNDAWLDYDASGCMGKVTNISYKSRFTVQSDYNWARQDTLKLFHGNGKRYVMDFYGKDLMVFGFNGSGFSPLTSVDDSEDRTGKAHTLTFLLKASNPPWWLITSRYLH